MKISFKKITAYLILIILVAFHLGTIIFFSDFFKKFPDYTEYLNGIIAIPWGIGLFILTNKVFEYLGLSKSNEFSNKKILAKRMLIGFIISVAFILLSASAYLLFTDTSASLLEILFPTIGFSVFILRPAILEEIIFRATAMNFFAQQNHKYLGLILASSFFGVIHLANVLFGGEFNVLQAVTAGVLGLLLGLMYLNFGLIPAIILHYLLDMVFYEIYNTPTISDNILNFLISNKLN